MNGVKEFRQLIKEQCLGSQVAVVNSSYWLAETQVGGGGGSRLAKRPLTIFDEADTLEGVLMGTVEIYISEYAQKKFNIKPPKKMTKEEEHVEWVRETIAHLQLRGFGSNRMAFASSVKESRDLRQGERLLQSLQGMAGDIEAGSRWVYTGGAGSDRRRLEADEKFRVIDKGSHWQIRECSGDTFCVMHKTQSDRRGFHNTVAQLRKMGFEWKGR